MATHTDDSLQYNMLTTKDYRSDSRGLRKRVVEEVYAGSLCPSSVYTWVNITKGAYMYTCTFTEGKVRMG